MDHLSQVPGHIRDCMTQAYLRWGKDDEDMDGVLRIIARDPQLEKVLAEAIRKQRRPERIRELVVSLKTVEPGLGMRAAFKAISLFLDGPNGHPRDISQIYYGSRR